MQFSATAVFGPEWANLAASIINDPMWEEAAKAGAAMVGEVIDADIGGKGWESRSGFEITESGHDASGAFAVTRTDQTPYVWVDEGVEEYSFGGPDYHMSFQEGYSAKTDGGDGGQSGEQYFDIQNIYSRGIAARGITDRVISEKEDEIIAAVIAAIGF